MRIFRDNLSTFTHWFGWTLAVIASLFFIVFDFGDWVQSILQGNGKDQALFFGFMIIAIGGVVVSLFKRKHGSLLMLGGGAGMVMFYYAKSGWMEADMMVVYGLPYILPAFLLLIVKK